MQQANRDDPDTLRRIITAMQAQRNQALDALAVTEAKNSNLLEHNKTFAENLFAAHAKITELEKKIAPAT